MGVKVAKAPKPAPCSVRTIINIATCTLPAERAPPRMLIIDATISEGLRPILSARGPPISAPRAAPKKNRALMAPRMSFVYAAPDPVVERLK